MSSGAKKIEITQSTLLKLLVRRGSDGERKNITLSEGELGYTVDTFRLFVGDSATVGGNPVSLELFFGSSPPTVYSQAVLGDLAYDSTQGTLYKLQNVPPTSFGNWQPFLTQVRVDNTTMQTGTFNGVPNTLQVKTISAAQLDSQIAGLGLEFSGNSLQTKASQTFDSINTRTAAALQIPATLKFGTVGGATSYTIPSFDGPAGFSLVTDGNGVIRWLPGNTATQFLVLSGNQVPAGTIVQFGSGGAFGKSVSAYQVPYGFFRCDGRTLSASNYTALYTAISTFYGGSLSAGTFNIPSLTGTNTVYLIKYLEDQFIAPVSISLQNTLTGLNTTTNSVITSFTIPPVSASNYTLGVPDYVSKTYVDTLYNSIRPYNSVYKLSITSEPNCSNGLNTVGAIMFIDQRNKSVRGNGWDKNGQFGIGNLLPLITYSSTIESPMELGDQYEHAEEIYGAGGTTFVLTNSGNVYVAGDSSYGIAGIGSTSAGLSFANSRFTKINIPAAAGAVTKISIGGGWGGSDIGRHAFALTSSGSAFAWGYNAYGQTGLNAATTYLTTPVCTNNAALAGKSISKIYSFVGSYYGFSYAIDTDSKVYCCGYNGTGNLGNGTTTNVNTGWIALNYTADEIYGVTGTTNNSTFLLSGGKLWGCGNNAYYQLGLNTNTPTNVTTFTPVCASGSSSLQFSGVSALSISDASYGSCTVVALMNDYTIRTWGNNGVGQCGIGTTATTYVHAPTGSFSGSFINAGINKVKAQGIGPYTTVFTLNSAGQIWSVGANDHSSIGDGSLGINTSTFVKAVQPRNIKYADFNVYLNLENIGYMTVAAVDTDGHLYSWGENAVSQTGINNWIGYTWNNLVAVSVPTKINFI